MGYQPVARFYVRPRSALFTGMTHKVMDRDTGGVLAYVPHEEAGELIADTLNRALTPKTPPPPRK